MGFFSMWQRLHSAGELPDRSPYSFPVCLNNRQEFFNYLRMGNCSIAIPCGELYPTCVAKTGCLPEVERVLRQVRNLHVVETAKANGLDAIEILSIYPVRLCRGVIIFEESEYMDEVPWDPCVQERGADDHCPFSIEG